MISAKDIINHFDMQPLPIEGGMFKVVYKSEDTLISDALPKRYTQDHSLCSSILYLLEGDTFSRMHKLITDEIWHFYMGDTVEMLQLYPDGGGRITELGSNILSGMSIQSVVPKNVWQGCRLKKGGKFALMGTTMAPSYEQSDYINGDTLSLIDMYPEFEKMIKELT